MGWKEKEGQLVKEFSFDDFVAAVGFIDRIVPLAEAADHHPDIFLHGYSKVKVFLQSHDAGKVTEKDVRLADEIDAVA